MAVIARGKNVVMEHVSGKLAGNVVYKQYVDKIVMANYPNMSRIVHTEKQKAEQSRFQLAVAYAKQVLATPAKKRAYQKNLKKGRTVYHTAIADFLNGKVKANKLLSTFSAAMEQIHRLQNSMYEILLNVLKRNTC
jgi:hypothetical protein